MDREYKLAMYDGFFDELGELEKVGMLGKEALGWGSVAPAASRVGKSIIRGFKSLGTNAPSKTVEKLRRAWRGGVRAKAAKPIQGPTLPGQTGLGKVVDPESLSRMERLAGGMRGVMRTGTGRALATTGLGLGAAGVGTATAIGAGRQQQPQVVVQQR